MRLIPVEVESYAGYRADEVPRRFCWGNRWIEVEEVVDWWCQAHSDPEWPMADYFKVLGADRRQYLLKHDMEADRWFLGRQW
jgi:hypothetical protein